MTNPNGTLATYLKEADSVHPDVAAGRESLSESLGVWLQIAVAGQDRSRFDTGFRLLQDRFLSPQKYIVWKLQPDGTPSVHTDALGDDLRILGALLEAYDRWHQPEHLDMARVITATLQTSLVKEGYFVDFHDFRLNVSASELSLVYIDSLALNSLVRHGLLHPDLFSRHMAILENMPLDRGFYPASFAISSQTYRFRNEVNLIDQLIIALHLAESGRSTGTLTAFLKREWERRGKLPGRYDRLTSEPTVDYESPSVYGLAMMLALKEEDRPWAEKLRSRLAAMRDQDPDYKGGYVFDGNSHIFDNLIPLLAETRLHHGR